MIRTLNILIGVVLLAFVFWMALSPAPQRDAAPVAVQATQPEVLDHEGWHTVDKGRNEVKWFSYLEKCYARATDGSTRDPQGKPGIFEVPKFVCAGAGALPPKFD
jgi:hypothetical protein